jgi:hypothetical protein
VSRNMKGLVVAAMLLAVMGVAGGYFPAAQAGTCTITCKEVKCSWRTMSCTGTGCEMRCEDDREEK